MNIVQSRNFRKKFKMYAQSGRKSILLAIHNVSHLLMTHDERSLYILRTRYRDHALTGHRTGMRELHLAQDDLLLYWIAMDDNIIILEDIVSHEELRKKK